LKGSHKVSPVLPDAGASLLEPSSHRAPARAAVGKFDDPSQRLHERFTTGMGTFRGRALDWNGCIRSDKAADANSFEAASGRGRVRWRSYIAPALPLPFSAVQEVQNQSAAVVKIQTLR
jgi:hypothetical protein